MEVRPTTTCEKCGRQGVRGFVTKPAMTITLYGRERVLPEITVCVAEKSCERRYRRSDH